MQEPKIASTEFHIIDMAIPRPPVAGWRLAKPNQMQAQPNL